MDTRPYPRVGAAGASAMPGVARRRMVIVDAHGHAFRAFWALEPMYAPDGLPTNALFGLAGLLKRLVFEDQPDYVAVVFDAPDDQRRTFRSALYPAYKAHRPERPADLARQIPVLRDVARAFGLASLEHPDFEADDIVATVVGLAEAADIQTTILSADKDLLQLVSDRTLVWDAMRGKRYTHAAVEDKLGVPPAMVADYLALCGDASDNVPGVPGIGPKSAAALLRAFGDLDAVYGALDAIPTRERTKLSQHRERAFLSRELTRLRTDVPLPGGLDGLARPNRHDAAAADALWERLGFRGFRPPGAEATRRRVRPEPARPHEPEPLLPEREAEPSAPPIFEPPPAREVHDLAGLAALVRAARAEMALGLAHGADGGPHGPCAVGIALPSGATFSVALTGGARGKPVQGSLFAGPDARTGLTLADVAAALDSLLADPRRVVCALGEAGSALGMRPRPNRVDVAGDATRATPDGAMRATPDGAIRATPDGAIRATDPAASALETLSRWLDAAAARSGTA